MVAVTEDPKKDSRMAPFNLRTRRVSGKPWKAHNSGSESLTSKPRTWEEKTIEKNKMKAVKALEKRLKDEKQAEKDNKRQIILDRRKAKEQKEREQALAEKMSAKRLQRMRKKEARKKARV